MKRYGYRCEKCGAAATWNLEESFLRRLRDAWPKMHSTLLFVESIPELHVAIAVGREGDWPELVEFLTEHYSHGVAVAEESLCMNQK